MTIVSQAYIYALKAGFPQIAKSAKSFAKLSIGYVSYLASVTIL
jgi:hypothetical protein